jgi:hypothetical protein
MAGRIVEKHEHFAWRNGNQLMQATADLDLSAAEVQNIERATHGIPVPERNLHAPDTGPNSIVRAITNP